MFKLKRPCANCPFKRGVGRRFQMRRARILSIVEDVAFQCHKTVDYTVDEGGRPGQGEHPQQCAGLMAMLTREGKPNNIMQVAMRFGHLDPSELDPDGEAYASLVEALHEHGHD